MSTLRVDQITDEEGTGAPDFPNGLNLGGAPIIESDENANGRFVKFADGTMICTTVVRIFPVDIVTGNMFRGLDSEDRPWPAEFIEMPVTYHCPGPTLSSVITFGGSTFSSTATVVRCRLLSSVTRGDQDAFSIGIGRWK